MTAGKARKPDASTKPCFDDAELAQLFRPLDDHARIALAVSGGGDSTALMLLVRRWIDRLASPPQITILTVDHGLRPESKAEDAWVCDQAVSLDFTHHTLVWPGEKPATGIQAAARDARYALMAEFCRSREISALATAHTLDDQAETVLMRLARGSGVDGLSGMATVSHRSGLTILRPLLGVSRARLETSLRRQGQYWLDDPSNRNEDYERVRLRRAMQAAGTLGLSSEKLSETAARARRARAALEATTSEFLKASLALHGTGFAELSADAWINAPAEIAIRALIRISLALGGRAKPPRLARSETAWDRLRQRPKRLTFGGCEFACGQDTIVITREFGRVDRLEQTIGPGGELLWDRRFRISVPPHAKTSLIVRPLGAAGLKAVKDAGGVFEAIPRSACLSLPSLWENDRLVHAPFAAFAGRPPQGWLETVSMSFTNEDVPFATGDRNSV